MTIGLKRGAAAVVPHDPQWHSMAQTAISALKDILTNDIVDAQHIGSTSIHGICAKPIIDIAVGVRSFDSILRHNEQLADSGFVYRGCDHPGQLLYVCGDFENSIQTHFIHVVIWGDAAWNNYLNMRDYLNQHPDKAAEYSALKQRLSAEYPNDRAAYTAGKHALIEEILRAAAIWHAGQ